MADEKSLRRRSASAAGAASASGARNLQSKQWPPAGKTQPGEVEQGQRVMPLIVDGYWPLNLLEWSELGLSFSNITSSKLFRSGCLLIDQMHYLIPHLRFFSLMPQVTHLCHPLENSTHCRWTDTQQASGNQIYPLRDSASSMKALESVGFNHCSIFPEHLSLWACGHLAKTELPIQL